MLFDFPAYPKQQMDQGLLFQAPFQGLDELVPLRFDLVFHVEDLLALAPLAAFEVFDLFL